MDPTVLDQCGETSVARWEPKLGLAEVLVKRGKLWSSMGVIRSSKLYFHVEEAIYMVEKRSLILLLGDSPIPHQDVYSLLTVPRNGCSWDAFQVFCHLKRFGYIVGRHNVAWSSSSQQKRQQPQVSHKLIEGSAAPNLVPESMSAGPGGPSSGLLLGEKPILVSPDAMTRCNQENSEPLGSCSHGELEEGTWRSEERNLHERVEGSETGAGSDAELCDESVVSLVEGEEDEAFATARKGGGLSSEGCEGSIDISLNLSREEDSQKDGLRSEGHERSNDISLNLAQAEDEVTSLGFTTDIANLSSELSALEVNDSSSDDSSWRALQESNSSLMFDVHQPNSRFKKTDPGIPAFSLCIVGGQPLEQKQVRELERKAADRPLKFGSVVGGHIFIYSFTSCELPTLP